MIVTVHQPTYLPYLGFFAKIASADAFILYDTAQYEKGSVHNRQRIRTAQGSQWLTIPLSSSLTDFRSTRISYGGKKPWNSLHWQAIEQSYKKTPHFAQFAPALSSVYLDHKPETLAEANSRFIRFLLDVARIKPRIHLFSELDITSNDPSEKLAQAVEKVGGREYIAGPSSKRYLDLSPFEARGIKVSFFEFQHPEYEQYHSRFDQQFLPNMASIDALFNLGRLPI